MAGHETRCTQGLFIGILHRTVLVMVWLSSLVYFYGREFTELTVTLNPVKTYTYPHANQILLKKMIPTTNIATARGLMEWYSSTHTIFHACIPSGGVLVQYWSKLMAKRHLHYGVHSVRYQYAQVYLMRTISNVDVPRSDPGKYSLWYAAIPCDADSSCTCSRLLHSRLVWLLSTAEVNSRFFSRWFSGHRAKMTSW